MPRKGRSFVALARFIGGFAFLGSVAHEHKTAWLDQDAVYPVGGLWDSAWSSSSGPR
ncbi:hypothetical protein [Amycolatopsis nivea]|uniref:hypothetical protein n=1 Tax=Amycolatopsis nivea TaxID=1644109 RepID=UPI00143160C4|nr:hypothetical protein [Amycolatopsis nivea]